MRIDPDASGFELPRDTGCFVEVGRPDGGAESHLRVVGPGNNVVFISPGQDGDDRAWGIICQHSLVCN